MSRVAQHPLEHIQRQRHAQRRGDSLGGGMGQHGDQHAKGEGSRQRNQRQAQAQPDFGANLVAADQFIAIFHHRAEIPQQRSDRHRANTQQHQGRQCQQVHGQQFGQHQPRTADAANQHMAQGACIAVIGEGPRAIGHQRQAHQRQPGGEAVDEMAPGIGCRGRRLGASEQRFPGLLAGLGQFHDRSARNHDEGRQDHQQAGAVAAQRHKQFCLQGCEEAVHAGPPWALASPEAGEVIW